jgi:hypothetical protein
VAVVHGQLHDAKAQRFDFFSGETNPFRDGGGQ